MNPVYIHGMGAISPQDSLIPGRELLAHPVNYAGDRLACIEPDYSLYIEIKYLRRMSRILKMGTAASRLALKEAGIAMPDGVITGTGYGCLEDTGTFIQRLVDQHEQALSPTSFIQSTHNTIGSQIALQLQCQGFNQTYTQESLSFESGLLDAQLSLQENPAQVLLTGSADEITDLEHEIQKRFGIFRQHSAGSLGLFQSEGTGTLHGEGAFYFALSGKKEKAAVSIDAVMTFINPPDETILAGIERLLKNASISADQIDLVLSGKNGIIRKDADIDRIIRTAFGSVPVGVFKHLCGEFPTASAFAVWLGARILQTNSIPDCIGATAKSPEPKTIVIYNAGLGDCHSLILMKKC